MIRNALSKDVQSEKSRTSAFETEVKAPVKQPQPRRLPGATSKAEVATVAALKRIFPSQVQWEKIRPPWLLNHTGKPMELDVFGTVTLGGKPVEIACEVDGVSHYVYPSRFFPLGSRDAFLKARERDILKDKICAHRKVVLIRVPFSIGCKVDAVENFLREEFHYRGLSLPERQHSSVSVHASP